MNLVTMPDAVRDLRNFAANPQQRVRTGFDSLDYYIEGPAAGEVCTIIGRSYTGKSLVATNIMVNHMGGHSIFFSLEMTRRMALTRLLTQYANFDANEVREAVAANRIPDVIDQMAEAMKGHIIVDKSGLTVADMIAVVEEYSDYFGRRPDFVQIDYLERIGGVKADAGGWQATEAAADQVKDLAKTMDIPVFLYHQTNRGEPEGDAPTERSARGGGFVEADFVVGMWAPARDPKMPEYERRAKWDLVHMNVLKNRYSGQANEPWRPLVFRRTDSLRFIEIADTEKPRDDTPPWEPKAPEVEEAQVEMFDRIGEAAWD